jgi:hypothetical protein
MADQARRQCLRHRLQLECERQHAGTSLCDCPSRTDDAAGRRQHHQQQHGQPIFAGPLRAELHAIGVAGGAVYDGLVGACAREHALTIATRDRRALETYRALDVRVELLS